MPEKQSAALNLSLNEENVTCETLDNVSCCLSLFTVEIIDSDDNDITKLDKMLLKLKSIGIKIKNVASNQAKIIEKVMKNSRKRIEKNIRDVETKVNTMKIELRGKWFMKKD